MIFAFVFLFALLFFAPPFRIAPSGDGDYLSKENALPIKGFYVLAVFFSHFKGYVSLSDSILDRSFVTVTGLFGQLIVTMFFFYSGYGIFSSYLKKDNYLKTFLSRRFLPVWASFAVCVLLFLVEGLCLGISYPIGTVLLSFTGWSAIGNSNWFMFVTFALYVGFYLCFRFLPKEKKSLGLILFTLFSLALVGVLYFTKESWWYDTLLCFTLGVWYANFKPALDKFLLKSGKTYALALLLSLLLLAVGYLLQKWHSVFFLAYAPAFTLFTVAVTVKVRFRSAPLSFLGKHVFSIYILQRLVFILAQHLGLHTNTYVFFAVTLVSTLAIAVAFDFAFGAVSKKLRH